MAEGDPRGLDSPTSLIVDGLLVQPRMYSVIFVLYLTILVDNFYYFWFEFSVY